MHKEHHGFLYAIVAAFALAANALLVRWLSSVPTETLVFFRFTLAILFCAPLIYTKKVRIHVKGFRKHLGRAVAGLIAMYCFFYSINHLSLIQAVTLFNVMPLFLPIVIFFWLKLVIPKARIWALVLGFIGVLIILRPDAGLQWAALIGLIGAMAAAIAQVGIRQLSKSESTETILTYYFLISLGASFFPMVFAWEPIDSPVIWLNLFLMGTISLIFQYCITKSLLHAPATKVSSMSYLGIVFSGLLGWALFDEVISFRMMFGVLFIVIGGVVAILSKEAPKRRAGH